MTFKEKIAKVKHLFENFDRLEKSVQAQLMAVADKMAPSVQGGGIAPKAIQIPEPVEYPDIEETVVHAKVRKHQLEAFADQFLKSDWQPVMKTQKNPSTTVPYEEKPHHRDYVAPTNNVTGQMKANRDSKNAISPPVPVEIHASGAMNKAEHQPHPGATPLVPSYNAARQRESEAHLKTPKGEAQRQAHNKKVVEGMKKAEIHGIRPATSPINPPAQNIPDEPSQRTAKILA
jgi:hypothetical protein